MPFVRSLRLLNSAYARSFQHDLNLGIRTYKRKLDVFLTHVCVHLIPVTLGHGDITDTKFESLNVWNQGWCVHAHTQREYCLEKNACSQTPSWHRYTDRWNWFSMCVSITVSLRVFNAKYDNTATLGPHYEHITVISWSFWVLNTLNSNLSCWIIPSVYLISACIWCG